MITLLTRIVGPATVELRHIAGAGTHLCRILNLASVTRTTRIATGVAHIVGEDAVRALQLSLADGSAVGLADILISIALAKDVATIDLTDHRHKWRDSETRQQQRPICKGRNRGRPLWQSAFFEPPES